MVREFIVRIDDGLSGAQDDIDELERKWGAEELPKGHGDLIDRDRALNELKKYYHPFSAMYDMVKLVIEIPEDIQKIMKSNVPLFLEQRSIIEPFIRYGIINGTPLPTGHWKRMSDLPIEQDDRWMCSRCGNVIHVKNKMDLITFHGWDARCGAKMFEAPTIIEADKENYYGEV